MDSSINVIIDFWFEGISDATPIDRGKRPFRKWFKQDTAFDEEIRRRFEGDLNRAFAGEYKKWEESSAGTLALVLLCDQFTRNMYRDTPRMYCGDALAQTLTHRMIAGGKDRELDLIYRVFIYMPLMHAEDMASQQLSVRCFSRLVEESKIKNPRDTHYYTYSLDYAKLHCSIIESFGRFPHRNKILGRTSTPREIEFLNKPGSKF